MQKVKVTLTAQTILQLDAGTHEAVRDGGNLYVLLQQEDGFEEAKKVTPEKSEPTKVEAPTTKAEPKAEVVDDTKAPAPKATRTRAKKEEPKPEPAPEPQAETDDDGLVEIPEGEWSELQEGDMVIAKLNMEGDDGEKLWKAEVVGMVRPKGSKEDKLQVRFLEDGQEDYLREGDRLFEYQEDI